MNLSPRDLEEIEYKTNKLIRSAGAIALKTFGFNKTLTLKDIRDVESETDLFIEEYLKRGLTKILNGPGFILEEQASNEKDDFNWVIDPVDGTKNYTALVPYFFTQLALVYRGKPILSEIYQPVSDQLFTAIKGKGTFLNGSKLIAKCRVDPKESIIDLDFRGAEDSDLKMEIFNKLVPYFYRVRSSGGMYSPYLVTGALDAYIDLFRTSKFFDILPRILVFEESGLQVKEIEVKEGKKVLIAARPELVKEIERIIL